MAYYMSRRVITTAMALSELSFALVLLKALVALAQEHQGNVHEFQINEPQGQIQENHGQVLHPQEQINQHQEYVNQHQEQVYHHQEQAHQHQEQVFQQQEQIIQQGQQMHPEQEQVHEHQEHILQEQRPHQEENIHLFEQVHLHQGHVHQHQDHVHQQQEHVQQNLELMQDHLEQVPHQHEQVHHSEAPHQTETNIEGQNSQKGQLLKFSDHDLQHHLYEETYLESSGMSESEKQYHFFVAHDYDNDLELDGTEIMQSLYHGADELVIPEEDLALKIDYLLKEFDFNQNGKLDFPEFMASSARFQ